MSSARQDEGVSGAAAASKTAGKATPVMAQYMEIRAANPDCLLFYRMGDFYELFFEDAEIASRVLGIHLTKRGKYLGQDIPMSGVPVKAADEYLQKLIASGYKVAVCEQMEDPAEAKKRGYKAVVRREVVRIVTKGTITEDNLLASAANNYLTALFTRPGDVAGDVALASLDLSTGEFLVSRISYADLPAELARLMPGEILVPDRLFEQEGLRQLLEDIPGAASSPMLSPLPFAHFNSLSGEESLKAQLGVKTLDAFGAFSRRELAAIGGLLKYVELTQLGARPAIRPPRRDDGRTVMVIDPATRASLELMRSQSGERGSSLLGAIDRTVTGAGARLLAARLASPLVDPEPINHRLDAVGFFVDEPGLREDIRTALAACPDLARALSRIVLGRASPRDLGSVRQALRAGVALLQLLSRVGGGLGLPVVLERLRTHLPAADDALLGRLDQLLQDELPASRADGGFVRPGAHDELDESRRLRDDSRKVLAQMQADYVAETGIKSLKIRHNNVLGYFVEVTAQHGDKLLSGPLAEKYRHRQTLASAVRFTTVELGETEARINRAADRALEIEREIFASLVADIQAQEKRLAALAEALAELDCVAGLGELAAAENYVRPKVDDSLAFAVSGGRHPVVEQAIRAAGTGPFIENDCHLSAGQARDRTAPWQDGGDGDGDADTPGRLVVLTGPNMAGKSTYLRQNALIAVLAQMGAYVPATSAHIGVIDRLFSRVGASDDLARGRSTFMVEMVETAAILNQAGRRALVILDEIGRGTATYDGLSIAWAVVEYLHETSRCRALFATHYHELTALAARLPHARNATIEVKEWQDEIIFLHRVIAGAANRSYGIQVARLAGLPETVIARAAEVLAKLEKAGNKPDADALADDLPLFAASRPQGPVMAGGEGATRGPAPISALEDRLRTLDPDTLSPRDALDVIYELKALLDEAKG